MTINAEEISEKLLKEIDEAIAAGKMEPADAYAVMEAIESWLETRMEAIEEEAQSEDGDDE